MTDATTPNDAVANTQNMPSVNISSDDGHIDTPVLLQRWQQVGQQLLQAYDKSGRAAIDNGADQGLGVTLLAVSKTKPAAMIEALAAAGQRHFGENYLQEAIEKITQLRQSVVAEQIVWHYIGHIQRNKTRDIAEHFDWVQTIERDIIARRLNDQRPESLPPLNVLIQVNIDQEASKSGCLPEELSELIACVKGYERLILRGLMIIPARDDTDAFERTQELFAQMAAAHPELEQWDTLSMGMSADMEQAIAAGSTMVRVGTAIFGARDTV